MAEPVRIIALIPAYNEAKRIEAVIHQTRQFLPVLVVDDGSQDDTIQRSYAAGAEVLPQKPNAGKGAALRAGFALALAGGYQAVLTLDADGQHDPAEVPLFIQKFGETSADLIIGARDFSQMPLSRKLANWSGTQIFSWAMGQKILDNQSGYRLISRRMMEAVMKSNERGFEFEVEMITSCLKNGWELGWVPIRTIYGDQGSHIHPLKHMLNFFRVALKSRREMRAR